MKHLIDQPVRVRTTVDLPRDLLDRSRSIVDRGLAKNQNVLFTAAIADYLDQLDEKLIDSQFETMETDVAYRDLNLALLDEFAGNDSQAQAVRDESP